ncbi:MAG: DNA-processing protein DprA [Euryarchaeota archaeon]|jgi:DNA processing protein|nr:DNA-processing protein DprA [Euryarchaeota archaeon]
MKEITLDDFKKINLHDIVSPITIESSVYPTILKEIKNPPKALYFKGNLDILNKPSIAVVGTRKPTKKGRTAVKEIVNYYGKKGCVIVSGLAQGIDSLALHAALEIKAPIISVLPSSIDNIVPKKNETLAVEIIKNKGLFLSEYPEGTKVQKYHFIQRNRIITGISNGVAIVETSIKGGTMHTVNFARDQNKHIIVADIPTDGNQKLIQESIPIFKNFSQK